MSGLIDTHAHLDFPDFGKDLELILQGARDAGLEKIISIGTCVESSRKALVLSRQHAFVYAAVGIHPCYVEEEPLAALDELKALLQQSKVAAIGECGLDYHHKPDHLENEHEEAYSLRWEQIKRRQASFFRAQLELAASHNLNVVVHQRDSWDDTLSILKEFTGRLQAVYHCFGGSPAQAAEVLALGHLVSFTGIITFKNADLVRETAKSLPAGSFMIETDCPYLAPVPYRGKRCEPAYVREIATFLADVRHSGLQELKEELWKTSHAFFRIGDA